VFGSPKQERIVNSISDVGADGENIVAGELVTYLEIFAGIDAASWPPLSRRELVGELAAALEEGSLTAARDDENGRLLTKKDEVAHIFTFYYIKCSWDYLLESNT
jgi:hypothetical protein